MIRIKDIPLPLQHSVAQLSFEAAQLLRVSNSTIRTVKIVRRSIDARKKPDVKYTYTIDVQVNGNEEKILRNSRCKKASIAPWTSYKVKPIKNLDASRPVVIGFGPAGMFAALVLAMSGARPIVLERGEDAETRHEKVQHFWQTGELDVRSNVQFGEGGAGTFSDGKLNTGVNNPRIPWVLQQFVLAGADEAIQYDAKPHVGTDVLLHVVQHIRNKIISLGGEVRFNAQVTGLRSADGRITGVELADGEIVECEHCILAIGHSARDTFRMLHDSGSDRYFTVLILTQVPYKIPLSFEKFTDFFPIRSENFRTDLPFSRRTAVSPGNTTPILRLVSPQTSPSARVYTPWSVTPESRSCPSSTALPGFTAAVPRCRISSVTTASVRAMRSPGCPSPTGSGSSRSATVMTAVQPRMFTPAQRS